MMILPPLASGYYALFVEGLRFDMRLGVNPEEVEAQPVQIDIAMVTRRLGDGDGIEDVVDYNHLRDAALTLAEERHFGLQETFCEVLIDQLRRHSGVAGIVVETRKLTVYKDITSVGCRMVAIDPAALA